MKKLLLFLLTLGLAFAFGACTPAPTPTEDVLSTAVAATLAAIDQTPIVPPENTQAPMATAAGPASPTAEIAPATATPTSTPVLTDAEAIKVAVNAYLSSPVDPNTITVSEIQGNLARGGIPGAYFIAARDSGNWFVVFAGQATPPCNLINPYNFPASWVPECFAENGSLVQRETGSGGTDFQVLGTPTWTDNMDSSSRWYLVSTSGTTFKVEGGYLVMTAHDAGGLDEWGLAAVSDQTDFALELTVKTGSTCSGLDRYGVIFRAPDPTQGYVFEFSCDGRFRLYEWDGETYTGLQNWKGSAAIVGGANQTNRMGLIARGDKVKLYANDQLLGEYDIPDYDSGRFGLVVGAKETAGFNAKVDTVKYWNLAGS
ncbi:MAG: family 16 glycoside hydrolase [Anaerolineales bacterium]